MNEVISTAKWLRPKAHQGRFNRGNGGFMNPTATRLRQSNDDQVQRSGTQPFRVGPFEGTTPRVEETPGFAT
jgi:hypothetical protein